MVENTQDVFTPLLQTSQEIEARRALMYLLGRWGNRSIGYLYDVAEGYTVGLTLPEELEDEEARELSETVRFGLREKVIPENALLQLSAFRRVTL